MATRPHRRSRHRYQIGPLLLLLGAVVLAWGVYGLAVFFIRFEGDPEQFWDSRGKFGDMFGAFNALASACAFAALIYGIHLEYKAFRRQELHTALSAQLDSMVQLYALPAEQREAVWRAIVSAPDGQGGRPGEELTMDKAIAIQIACLDRLNAAEDLDAVPTYGRLPRGDGTFMAEQRPSRRRSGACAPHSGGGRHGAFRSAFALAPPLTLSSLS